MRRLPLPFLFLCVLPLMAAPDFSGSWKINKLKSDFGPMPPPDSLTMTIDHKDPKLTVVNKQSRDGNEFESTSNYTTDGKECVNEFRGNSRKSTLKWEGETLVTVSKAKLGENDITITEKWVLSGEGKVLTISRHIVTPRGESDTKMTLDKQ
ncbi:MAG: hypothetical protein HY821_12265 [Acidobacteria bacterium]|nr:hypothetical protein [Acidobacteriota bacterium]